VAFAFETGPRHALFETAFRELRGFGLDKSPGL